MSDDKKDYEPAVVTQMAQYVDSNSKRVDDDMADDEHMDQVPPEPAAVQAKKHPKRLESRSITSRLRGFGSETGSDAPEAGDDKLLAIDRYKHVAIERKNGRVYWKKQAHLPDGQRHIVFVEMKITRISEINTSDETFRCTFHVFFTWLARFDLFFLYAF